MSMVKRVRPYNQSNIRETMNVWISGEQDATGKSYVQNIPFNVGIRVRKTINRSYGVGKTTIDADLIVNCNPIYDREGTLGTIGAFVLPIRTEKAVAKYAGEYYEVVQIADNNSLVGDGATMEYALKRTNVDESQLPT